MLKKVILAAAFALAFVTTFDMRGAVSGSRPSANVASPANACDDPFGCHDWRP